jgi:thiol-disulfide isomerase/thioredoxin
LFFMIPRQEARPMAERQRPPIGRARLALTVTAAVAVLAAGVYVTLKGQGNGAASAACAASRPLAASLDPLVHGEIAAFQVAGAPDDLSGLAFTGPDGKEMTLAAFKGKVALVNLWATWCGPCRKEMPALDRLAGSLGGEDFSVVPVSIDVGERQRPEAFLKQIGVQNLPLYTDRSTEIFESLKKRGLAIGLPVTLLLDRNGCRLGHINGPAEWDSEDGKRLIEAALARPASG